MADKWYQKPVFTSFWNHYNHCNDWLQKNGHKIVEFSDEVAHNGQQIRVDNRSAIASETNPNELAIDSTGFNDRQTGVHRLDTLESIDENEYKRSNRSEELIPIGDNDNDMYDISEEYLRFTMKTKRHQLERKRLKEKRLRYSARVEYVDISRMDTFSTRSVAPKKPEKSSSLVASDDTVGEQELSAQEVRRQKMHDLYGEDYNLIQGMEAALQLNFDRLCDLNQPKFWPIMPIRMPRKR